MPLINTSLLGQNGRAAGNSLLSPSQIQQVYCGLDSCVTLEVRETLEQTYGAPPAIYSFERAIQAPYLEMMQRGFRIDETARRQAVGVLRERKDKLEVVLNELASAVWDKGLNPRSPTQLLDFFYSSMKLPEITISQKGVKKLSMNREVLEKLGEYLYARPFVNLILTIREIGKQLDVFETEIDSDGRFRTSYNIAGTETGRPSSSENAFGTGGNAQNIAPPLRFVFVADPGWKLCVIDLEQVEARDVGFFCGCLFDDWRFLDACEGGDLHTANSRLIWPDLPWTGELKKDKEIAARPFYRDFSFRDMAKRGGHLCLTDDHEVLTPSGWVPISSKPSIILQFSESRSKFVSVSNWIDEEYEGNLHLYEGNSVSALMTPNHRIPFKRDARTAKVSFRAADKGPAPLMPLGWGFVGGDVVVPARLIAAFMSDGHQKSRNRMEFHFHKERKFKRLEYLCNQYGFEFVRKGNKIVVNGRLPKHAGAYMLNWTKESIVDFVDEYKHWDGHISETAVSLFSVHKEELEWIQTLGRITGIGGSINHSVTTSTFSKPNALEKTYVTDYYSLQQNHRQYASGKSVNWRVIKDQKRRVYCPTVDSSMFYVRRNGKIFVTGNSNYSGTPFTMARSLKIPQKIAEDFQARYCRGAGAAYECIARWWQWTAEQLQTTHLITTPFGRTRHFFGRPGDDATLREAIAFLPQSTTADRMNLILWRVWKNVPNIQVLAQTYDSITFQFRETENEDDIIGRVLSQFDVELVGPTGRRYTVPGEPKVGWNWGYRVTKADQERAHRAGKSVPRLNLDGLDKWKSGKPDGRERTVGIKRIGA